MSAGPQISVVMSVYNGQKYLRRAIDSILGQTFSDFEFIIINDGSSDDTAQIIKSYDDPRIRLINQENQGLVKALNRGIGEARGRYIARMDDDDISAPNRLELQLKKLESQPELALVSSCFEVMNEDEQPIMIETTFTEDEDIRRTMFLRNPIGHGSVMMRKDLVIEAGGYRDKFGHNEDFDLWRRLASTGKLASLPHVLYRWRVNTKGISQTNSQVQSSHTQMIVSELWRTRRPQALSRKHIKARAAYYKSADPSLGLLMKPRYLESQLLLGLALMKHGALLDGGRHSVATLTSGKSGLRVGVMLVVSRLHNFINRVLRALVRALRGRQAIV